MLLSVCARSAEMQLTSNVEYYAAKVGAATGVAAVVATSYTVWTARGGYLVASFLSSLPAWTAIDPLPIIASQGDNKRKPRERIENEETLQSMIARAPGEPSITPDQPFEKGDSPKGLTPFSTPRNL